MRQSVADTDVDMEVKESTVLGAVTRQVLVKIYVEGLVRGIVNCKECELATAL
jgi:predicted thioredoxin/glutaredoxin